MLEFTSQSFSFINSYKKEISVISFLQNKTNNELTITEKKFLDKKASFSELIEQEFKRLFQSYALAYNKIHNRQGNLFYKPFKRVKIEKDTQFTMTMVYIHANGMKHGLVKDFTKYPWSSWQTIISNQPTLLARKEVIQWFGSLELCIKAHNDLAIYYYDCATALEN